MLRLILAGVLGGVLGCGEGGPPADAGTDGSTDAGTDASADASTDASTGGDAGTDASVPDCTGSAAYELEFNATWSKGTHPDGFPSGPHFSPLIGATHEAAFQLWTLDALASPGIERMAELGATSTLASEIDAAINGGVDAEAISGGGIGTSPGSVSVAFQASGSRPYLSVTSMLAPSPDWFVGVDSLSLCRDGEWIERAEIDLLVYDAGTDSGTTYEAANMDTVPAEGISEILAAPFYDAGGLIHVGQFVVRLET